MAAGTANAEVPTRQGRDRAVWGVVAAGDGIGGGVVLCYSVAVEGMEGGVRSCATV